eukprot:1151426-Pelagomonas_calceolata.AAC.7
MLMRAPTGPLRQVRLHESLLCFAPASSGLIANPFPFHSRENHASRSEHTSYFSTDDYGWGKRVTCFLKQAYRGSKEAHDPPCHFARPSSPNPIYDALQRLYFPNKCNFAL